jgi:hypothetical protein
VREIDTEVTYHVVYQEEGKDNWYVFTNTRGLFEHALPYDSQRTTDLAEAMNAARGLAEGTLHTTDRVEHRRTVTAAQVYQLITTGGVAASFGEPTGESLT